MAVRRGPTHHRGYVRGGPGDEADILSCGHCQFQIEVKPGNGVSTPVDFCRNCMRFICPRCEVARLKTGCTTWETMIDRMEARGRLLKSIGVEER